MNSWHERQRRRPDTMFKGRRGAAPAPSESSRSLPAMGAKRYDTASAPTGTELEPLQAGTIERIVRGASDVFDQAPSRRHPQVYTEEWVSQPRPGDRYHDSIPRGSGNDISSPATWIYHRAYNSDGHREWRDQFADGGHAAYAARSRELLASMDEGVAPPGYGDILSRGTGVFFVGVHPESGEEFGVDIVHVSDHQGARYDVLAYPLPEIWMGVERTVAPAGSVYASIVNNEEGSGIIETPLRPSQVSGGVYRPGDLGQPTLGEGSTLELRDLAAMLQAAAELTPPLAAPAYS